MSYARWGGGSDVYVFADAGGGVTCCGCILSEAVEEHDRVDALGIKHFKGDPTWGESFHFYSVDSLIEHFQEHIRVGNTIPAYLLDPSTYDSDDFEVAG